MEIRLYSVIYHLVEDIDQGHQGQDRTRNISETLIGKVEILQKFKISKVGNVAGCLVQRRQGHAQIQGQGHARRATWFSKARSRP